MLELHEVDKRYGEVTAVESLSFTVEPGEVFGFVGPNGAGKTTTMRIVIGVLAPDSGTVTWNGRPIGVEDRRRVGYMPEERGLYPKMRVAEQLSYLAQLHGLTAAQADAAAERWIDRLGLADRAGDRVEKLSLGNQQRVQLGAALAHQPDLLILDEPFSGLDPVGVDVMSEVLVGEARERGVPVVFSSHQLDLVERLCDAVAIIAGGRLVASGKVGELEAERGGSRWHVELEGESDWSPTLAGARPASAGVFELDEGVDPQALLDEARGRGAVRSFGPVTPTLAELFRDVVSEERG